MRRWYACRTNWRDAEAAGIARGGSALMPLILFSVLLAFVLNAVSLPEPLRVWRPEFVLMACLYWVIHATPRFGMGRAWIAGLLMDVLSQTPLGVHAFAYLLVAAIAWRSAVPLRMVGMVQEALAVAGLMLLAISVEQLLLWIAGTPDSGFMGLASWGGLLPSLILWPVVAYLLGRLRRGVEIYP